MSDDDETIDKDMASAMAGTVIQTTMLVPLVPLEAVLREKRRFDTVGPIFAPSAWMAHNQRVIIDAEVLEAFLVFARRLHELHLQAVKLGLGPVSPA